MSGWQILGGSIYFLILLGVISIPFLMAYDDDGWDGVRLMGVIMAAFLGAVGVMFVSILLMCGVIP